jgi:hypothetical protein
VSSLLCHVTNQFVKKKKKIVIVDIVVGERVSMSHADIPVFLIQHWLAGH